MFELYTDKNGSFQELAHYDDVEFGQISLLKVNAGCNRGGHYHTRKREWFACIRGKCVMELANIRDGSKHIISLTDDKKEFIFVQPYERHTVINRSTECCQLLVIVSEKYNANDADTFKE